jgi:Predicted membrane protein
MKRFTSLICIFLVAVLVAAMIGWSIAAGNFLVPVVAIPLGVIVVLACRRNVEEVIADERERKIYSQAALRTLEVAVIIGAIAAVILLSFTVSDTLTPKITGSVYSSGNGTDSMVINLYRAGSPETPENLIRTVTIRDIHAMNEDEARVYCQFRNEAFLENEQKGLVGMTIGAILAVILVTYGAFYLYYNKKY